MSSQLSPIFAAREAGGRPVTRQECHRAKRCTLGAWVVVLVSAMPGLCGVAGAQTDWPEPDAQPVPSDLERVVDPLLLLPINVDGLWGYADRTGTVVVAPQYDWTDYFFASMPGPSGKEGSMLCRARMTRGEHEQHRLFADADDTRLPADAIREKKAWPKELGPYVNHHQVVASPVGEQWMYGMIGRAGTFIVEPIYDGMLPMTDDGLAAFDQDGLCGYIDDTGSEVIPARYAQVRSFRDGLAAVRQARTDGHAFGYLQPDGSMRFVDTTGRIDDARNFVDGRAAVRVGNRWGYLDDDFKAAIPPKYRDALDFAAGRAAVQTGRQWAYIDAEGETVAEGFDEAHDFETFARSGLREEHRDALGPPRALIKKGDRYAFIGVDGQEMDLPPLEAARPFYRGVARVKLGNSFGYVDADGALVWDPRRAQHYGIENITPEETYYERATGLPIGEVSQERWGQPYPFPLHAEDRLPFSRTRPHETWTPGTSAAPARR